MRRVRYPAVTGRRAEGPFNLVAQRVPLSQLDAAAGRTHDRAGDAFQLLCDELAYLKLSAVAGTDAAEYVGRATASKVLVLDAWSPQGHPAPFALLQSIYVEVTQRTQHPTYAVAQLAPVA